MLLQIFELFGLLFSGLGALFWLAVLVLLFVRIVPQYQRVVRLRFGKFKDVLKPGINFVIPIVDALKVVDVRVETVDVPRQEMMTLDNVPVTVNAVVFFRVVDPAKAYLEVRDFHYAVSQYALTCLRDIVGEHDLDTVLAKRDELSKSLREIVDRATDPWGIDVTDVKMQDIELPQDLKRTMAKVAETDRERRSIILKAEGEMQASKNYGEAAKVLAKSPGGMHLRTLQSLNDLSSDQSNTVVFAIPIEILDAIRGVSEAANKYAGTKNKGKDRIM